MKNLVLLTIDTMRHDLVAAGTSGKTLTPFLDSIRNKSMEFTRCYSIAPYTQASFPAILTSSYLFDHEDYGKNQRLSRGRTLISEVLKDAGVTTAGFHSNPYLFGFFGWNRGWHMFYDSMDADVTDEVPFLKGDAINMKIKGWLSRHIESDNYAPFFLWTHYMDLHEPYIPDAKYLEQIDRRISLTSSEMFRLFTDVLLKRDVSNRDTIDLLRKLYCARVIEADQFVSDLFGLLEATGVLRDSVVIMTADHGEEFGEHGGLSHDGKMYAELVRVPLLIFDGARSMAGMCDNLVSSVDIPPTIVHFYGLPEVPSFQGRSLLPVAAYRNDGCYGEAIDKRGPVKDTDRPVYFYCEDNYKVIYRAGPASWEMYDLKNDPNESANICDSAPNMPYMKAKLQSRINRH